MYRLIVAWFAQAGLHGRPRMELNHPLALRSLVAAGQGAALLPLEQSDVRSGDPDNAGLQVRPLYPPLLRELGLAYRMDQAHSAATGAVIAALQALA